MSNSPWTADDAARAISAKRKLENGESPSQIEERALKRVEKAFRKEAAEA